jgi:hypothetical protein
MTTRTFELTTTVPVAPEAAIDFLVDLSRHRGLHPFVVSADVVASGRDADGDWQDWRVVERPRLGPVRYTIRFPTRMTRTGPTAMRGDVRAAPGCMLVTRTTATADAVAGHAIVHELTTVSAPRLVLGYMAEQARVAHARTFALLPAELDTRP